MFIIFKYVNEYLKYFFKLCTWSTLGVGQSTSSIFNLILFKNFILRVVLNFKNNYYFMGKKSIVTWKFHIQIPKIGLFRT